MKYLHIEVLMEDIDEAISGPAKDKHQNVPLVNNLPRVVAEAMIGHLDLKRINIRIGYK